MTLLERWRACSEKHEWETCGLASSLDWYGSGGSVKPIKCETTKKKNHGRGRRATSRKIVDEDDLIEMDPMEDNDDSED